MSAQRSALAIVLAAGEGARMKSYQAKVLRRMSPVAPCWRMFVVSVAEAGIENIAVVVGPGRDDVRDEALRLAPKAEVFAQNERFGTGHAVLAQRVSGHRKKL
jgi:bifunctional UDP-N-acetylglucosamine pyrophosphorylase/glucosamine-1-phosphate N-acetyltransferase